MSFNFPNAPIEGQTYTPVGGYQYVWTDGKWRVVESPQVRATAETRNRIVNGAMQVSQENGNTAGTASAWYAADQFIQSSTHDGVITTQRVQVVTPNGSANRFRVTMTTADATMAAGQYASIYQPVEGIRIADFRWGTASARQVILRFGWKSPAGTYSFRISNGATNDRSYVGQFVISAGQANTDTEQTFVIPGDVTGTWATDTGIGIYLRFIIALGSTYHGATGWQAGNFWGTSANTNGMATAGNVFELFDVGLYLDPNATGLAPPWVMPDEAQELAACQRYWERMTGVGFSGNATSASYYNAFASYKVTKRIATPALSRGSDLMLAGFPATGTFTADAEGFTEQRQASATANCVYRSTVIVNARM